MMRWIFEAVVFGLMLLASATGHALTIDAFDGNKTVVSIGTGDEDIDIISSSATIGGTRAIKTAVIAGPGTVELATLNGWLYHSQTAQTAGTSKLTWDGDNAAGDINFSGLGAINFLQDSATAIKIRAISYDQNLPTTITVTLYDASDPAGFKFSQGSITLVSEFDAAQDFLIPFATMTAGPGGAANLKNIGAVTLFINGQSPNVDLALDWIGTNGICEQVPDAGGRVIDECGVCGGDSSSCAGCDGIPNSEKVIDQCGVCDGNGQSCLDCAGTIFGSAKLDRCGVCGGDGLSCVSCTIQDIKDLLATLDGQAKKQEKQIKRLLANLKPYAKDASTKRFIKSAANKAHELQLLNWTLTWQIPSTPTICEEKSFCITVSYQSKVDEYRARSEELRKLAFDVGDLLTKKSGKLSRKNAALLRGATRLHEQNLKYAATVPVEHSLC